MTPTASLRAITLSMFATGVAVFAAVAPYPEPIPPLTDHRHGTIWQPHVDVPVLPYQVTAYCSCPICCGQWADGRTASGTWAREGRTIAADPTLFSMGTCLSLPGIGKRIVEDTGSAILWRSLDVFINNHARARRFGVLFLDIEECNI